jgi:hypothetical protein
MDVTKLKSIIKERENTNDEYDYGIEQCHKKMLDIITQDAEGTVDFLRNECTANEFSWLSEIFDEIAVATNSHEIIDALYFLCKKYPEESKIYNILPFVENAESLLKQAKSNQ